MGVVISPSSQMGRELWTWNHTTREFHPDDEDKPEHMRLRGRRSPVFVEFPKMLYKAQKNQMGKYQIGLPIPNIAHYPDEASYNRACLEQEAFNRSTQWIVHSADEEQKAKNEGWTNTSDEALRKADAWEKDIAQAAAEANFKARGMSEGARREFEQAQGQTHEHVTDVQPRRKRGRPAKGVEAVSA